MSSNTVNQIKALYGGRVVRQGGKVKHPTTGKTVLRFAPMGNNMGTVAYRDIEAKYTSGDPYWISETFATIRPAHNGNGIMVAECGYVVARNSFDETREFGTLEEAKAYVESIYALEQ